MYVIECDVIHGYMKHGQKSLIKKKTRSVQSVVLPKDSREIFMV